MKSGKSENASPAALRPVLSCPVGQCAYDPVGAALIRLDALYEYAAAAGDMPEAQRICEEMAWLADQL